MPKRTWLVKSTALLSTGIMACFGLTGMAAAATITNTGANSVNRITSNSEASCYVSNDNNIDLTTSNNQSAVSGDAVSSENTGTTWEGWSDWNPVTWQVNNASFSDWWSGLMSWTGERLGANDWNSDNNHLSWHPSGTNWQDIWSNWNPTLWQANGQSMNNWHSQLMQYLNSHSGRWMITWTGNGNGHMGGVSTGNATNSYNANVNISVVNGGSTVGNGWCYVPSNSGGNGGSSIGNTGSGSTNVIKHSNHPEGHVLAANTISASNGNTQGAVSGAFYGSQNTGYGGGTTGNAGNSGHVSGTVGVSNNTGGKGGGPTSTPPKAPAAPSSTISNTGYSSENVISSRENSESYVTNTNNISYSSTNTQTAVTGNVTSSQNTTVGSDGSGNATNNAGSGGSVGIKNQ